MYHRATDNYIEPFAFLLIMGKEEGVQLIGPVTECDVTSQLISYIVF